jgi:hypothetical protein
MRYKKRPVEVEAFQWDGSSHLAEKPQWYVDANGISYNPVAKVLYIETLEGCMTAQIGDWIVKGVKGELYPCKPDIFDLTYEAVE